MDHIKIFAKQRTSIRTIILCSFHKTKIPDKSIKVKLIWPGFENFNLGFDWILIELANIQILIFQTDLLILSFNFFLAPWIISAYLK